MSTYRSNQQIFDSIIEYEAKNPDGLNGFILLLHLGTDPARHDKFYDRLDDLLNFLHNRRYAMVRIDKLLTEKRTNQ